MIFSFEINIYFFNTILIDNNNNIVMKKYLTFSFYSFVFKFI